MPSLAWDPAQREPVIVLFTVTAAYVAYHYGVRARSGAPAEFYRQRIGGFVLLGVVPFVLAMTSFEGGVAAFGLGVPDLGITAAFVGATAVVMLPIVYASSKRPDSWAHYPQIRTKHWTTRLYVNNALTWALYLFGYELMFRGVLLLTLERWTGPWPAIAITTGLYVLAHVHKNAAETIGCIPMGVVFAVAALLSGGFWAPWLMHVLIAVSSEWFVTRANPEIECSS